MYWGVALGVCTKYARGGGVGVRELAHTPMDAPSGRGVHKDVEPGAVIWAYFHDWKREGT